MSSKPQMPMYYIYLVSNEIKTNNRKKFFLRVVLHKEKMSITFQLRYISKKNRRDQFLNELLLLDLIRS